jgi:peptide deformylase
MIYEIKKYGEAILKQKASPVTEFDQELKTLFDDMLETMYSANGQGLAANQIGILKQVIVMDVSDGEKRIVYRLANPMITEISKEKINYDEGCLSFPGITDTIDRPAKIVVKAQGPDGSEIMMEAEGLLAICLQHEIDHLNGITFIERMSPIKKMMHSKELKELKKFGSISEK